MVYIAIKKSSNGKLYIDKDFFSRFKEEDLNKFGYQKTAVPKKYFEEIRSCDFNIETLVFDENYFISRVEREKKLEKLPRLQSRLNELSQDIIQSQCGAVFEDLEDRIKEFQSIHNEIREIQGKEPRIYQ